MHTVDWIRCARRGEAQIARWRRGISNTEKADYAWRQACIGCGVGRIAEVDGRRCGKERPKQSRARQNNLIVEAHKRSRVRGTELSGENL